MESPESSSPPQRPRMSETLQSDAVVKAVGSILRAFTYANLERNILLESILPDIRAEGRKYRCDLCRHEMGCKRRDY
jgi:hypothetical protein